MKVLVTGAGGFVGRQLVPALAATHTVHATVRGLAGPAANQVEWHQADLSLPLDRWSLPAAWDAVIYLAQSDGYRDFPARAADMAAVNVQAMVQLLDESLRRGASRFILASSANVYAPAPAPIDERTVPAPATFYAKTKRAAEMLAEAYASHLAVTIVRMFTVYGPGQKADTLVSSLIERVRTDRPVQVQGKRGLLLSPVFVSDAVDGLGRILLHDGTPGRADVFNLGGDAVVGVGELAAVIGQIAGRSVQIEPVAGHEPGGWTADARALRAATGWAPRVTLAEGLRATMDVKG